MNVPNERGEDENAVGPRLAYLMNLVAARALIDDGQGFEHPVFECGDPACMGAKWEVGEFLRHRNLHNVQGVNSTFAQGSAILDGEIPEGRILK